MSATTFSDLPEDVILLVVPYLRPKDFLALCSVNRHFHETYCLEPSYWREETRRTFRLPIHPLLKADGPRWHWLYNKLRTQTRVYTWGQRLVDSTTARTVTTNRSRLRRHIGRGHGSPWPVEADGQDDIGVVVDVQCGGWSSTLLNADGMLYTSGKLDGTQFRTETSPMQTLMKFSPAYPPTTRDRYEPATAIQQFSSGRRHVLALSDLGKIWYWTNAKPALQVKFLHLDILEGDQRRGDTRGAVKRVVAGWEESSAYVFGAGIVYWNIFKSQITHDEEDEPDTVLLDATAIPGTDFKRPKSSNKDANQHDIGEVLNHIVLHEYIVFITDLNKVFAMSMKQLEEFDEFDRSSGIPPNDVFEITTFSAPDRQLKDIQGAFESFAIFSSDGSVQIGDRNMLRQFWGHQRWPLDNVPDPRILPALQSSNVISLAFGDHHIHALHSSGRISSYGTEPMACGALGLGGVAERRFRGVKTLNHNGDGKMVPHGEQHPHYIWFEEAKRDWLYRLDQSSKHYSASNSSQVIATDPVLQGEFSEWVEQEGLAWDDFPDIRAQDPDGLGAYFALNVAAAGWHSCALVLVNEELAKQVQKKHIHGGENIPPDEEILLIRSEDESPNTSGYANKEIQAFRYDFFDQPFPRVRLPSQDDFGGDGPFREWRYGMPPVRCRADESNA